MSLTKPQLIIFGSIGAVVLVALAMLLGIIPGLKQTDVPPFTIEVWDQEDPPQIWREIISSYNETVKSATINYVKKDPKTYEAELVNALASDKGPDIFFLEDGQLEKHGDKIKPLADGSLGYKRKDIKNVFADSVVSAVTGGQGELLGVPMFFDTLALFYNRDYFNSANIASPPATWDELVNQSQKLTKTSEVGSIIRSGAALGTASNVEHSSDILLALIYQSGGQVIDTKAGESLIDNPATVSALLFYTSFANSTKKTYAWNSFFANSLEAFAKGDTVMAFGYAKDVKMINGLNPQLNFDAAPLPQPTGQDTEINLGRFRLAVVSRLSKESDNAWRFLLWLESQEAQKKYIDLVGLPPSRRDLVNSKPPSDYLNTFYDQVLSARTIPVAAGMTIPKVLNNMIDAVVNRKFSISEAINRAEADINSVFKP